MKQRNPPFGYVVQEGQVMPYPTEADAVRGIFEAYIQGASYKEITENFTRLGPRYHAETAVWNKNMVKRILENRRYLGERYPALVSPEIFSAAVRIRQEKQTGTHASDAVRAILKTAVCGVCGAPMRRDTKNTAKGRWYCSGGNCPHVKKLHDADLIERVSFLLKMAAANPSAVEFAELDGKCVSLDVTRLRNELDREMDKTDFDEAAVTQKILELSAARYAACPDETTREKSLALKALFEHRAYHTGNFDTELFNGALEAVLIFPDGSVSLRLKNGRVISNQPCTEEKGGVGLCRRQDA